MAEVNAILAYGVGDRARVGGRLGLDCGRPGCRANGTPRCISPTHLTDAQRDTFLAALVKDAGRIAAAEAKPAAQPETKPETKPEAKPEVASEVLNDFQKAVLGALGATGGGSFWGRVEAAAVKAAQEAIAGSPVTRIEVVQKDGEIHKVEGLRHYAFARVLKLLSLGQNVFLTGPSGCGKSVLAKQVAEALGKDFYMTSFSGSTGSGAIVGRQTGLDGDYEPSELAKAYENAGKNPKGSLWFGDEVGAVDPNEGIVMNGALAGDTLCLEKRKGNPYAKRDPGFACIVADNTTGEGADRRYTARNKQDGSFLSRFRAGLVYMDYDPKIEAGIAEPDVLQWAQETRKELAKAGIDRVLDTRFIADASRLRKGGLTLTESVAGFFVGWKPDELAKIPARLVHVLK